MPAGVVSISARRPGTYVLLEAALPGEPVHNIGVLLIDPATDRGYLRMRGSFDDLTEDTEVLDALEEDLRQRISELGASAFLEWMEDSWSNVLRVSEREAVKVDSFTRVVESLFDQHVEKVEVAPYRSHLPLYTLRAAAGYLSDEGLPEPEDWVPAPASRRPSQDMFVVHVEGRSMEPLIPDGSLNLFRYGVQGSRQGKVVLIERFGVDQSARYSVKRYTSTKNFRGEDQWEHGQITFIPVNPEYDPWSPEPGEFRILAEWLGTLE